MDERLGVLLAVADDLVNGVEERYHRVPFQIFGRSLLAARQVAYQVPQSVAACRPAVGSHEVLLPPLLQTHILIPNTAGTYEVFIPSVHGQVTECDGHRSHHFIHVGAQQLHQDGQTLLFSHRGSNVTGPL